MFFWIGVHWTCKWIKLGFMSRVKFLLVGSLFLIVVCVGCSCGFLIVYVLIRGRVGLGACFWLAL